MTCALGSELSPGEPAAPQFKKERCFGLDLQIVRPDRKPDPVRADAEFYERFVGQRHLAVFGFALVFEGNFEAYEEDKIRRLGPDSVEPKRVKYKKFTR